MYNDSRTNSDCKFSKFSKIEKMKKLKIYVIKKYIKLKLVKKTIIHQ